MRRVYLAGDMVFRPGALAIYHRLRAICARLGLEGAVPLEEDEALHGVPPGEAAIMAIVAANREMMDRCDGGLFCLDPFRRAPDMDPGTAVEIGYMFARGKPLAGYTADGRAYSSKVESYFATAWRERLRARCAVAGEAIGQEDADGVLVPSDGLVQNAMVDGFIRMSGGRVHADPDFYAAFEAAARDLARRLG